MKLLIGNKLWHTNNIGNNRNDVQTKSSFSIAVVLSSSS